MRANFSGPERVVAATACGGCFGGAALAIKSILKVQQRTAVLTAEALGQASENWRCNFS